MLRATGLFLKKKKSLRHNDDVIVTSLPAGEMFLTHQYSLTLYRREFRTIIQTYTLDGVP
jgi:hypothetical protein